MNSFSRCSYLDLEKLLVSNGATKFIYQWQEGSATVEFVMSGYCLRILVILPTKGQFYRNTLTGKVLSVEEAQKVCVKVQKEKWRKLISAIESKLWSVRHGVEFFEEAFLPYIVMPTGATVGEITIPNLRGTATQSTAIKLRLPSVVGR